MIYLQLFYNFFITGLFSIGGGLATLPFLYDLSDKTGWFTHAELANMLAVSESTPGAIGINMATYVGFETASLPGAVIATLGLIAPGIIIIQRKPICTVGSLRSQGGVYRSDRRRRSLGSADLSHTLQIAGTKRGLRSGHLRYQRIASRSRNPDRNPDMEKTSSRHLDSDRRRRGNSLSFRRRLIRTKPSAYPPHRG